MTLVASSTNFTSIQVEKLAIIDAFKQNLAEANLYAERDGEAAVSENVKTKMEEVLGELVTHLIDVYQSQGNYRPTPVAFVDEGLGSLVLQDKKSVRRLSVEFLPDTRLMTVVLTTVEKVSRMESSAFDRTFWQLAIRWLAGLV